MLRPRTTTQIYQFYIVTRYFSTVYLILLSQLRLGLPSSLFSSIFHSHACSVSQSIPPHFIRSRHFYVVTSINYKNFHDVDEPKMSCGLVVDYQRFGRTYLLRLQCKKKTTAIGNFTALRTSNPISLCSFQHRHIRPNFLVHTFFSPSCFIKPSKQVSTYYGGPSNCTMILTFLHIRRGGK